MRTCERPVKGKGHDPQLRKASEHVAYELRMLTVTYRAWTVASQSEFPVWFRIVLVESFLIHARNLIEFFNCKTSKRGNIKAVAFLPDDRDWQGLQGSNPLLVRREFQKINEFLAHLTWSRVETEAPRWNLDSIFEAHSGLATRFADFARPNTLAKSMYQALELLKA